MLDAYIKYRNLPDSPTKNLIGEIIEAIKLERNVSQQLRDKLREPRFQALLNNHPPLSHFVIKTLEYKALNNCFTSHNICTDLAPLIHTCLRAKDRHNMIKASSSEILPFHVICTYFIDTYRPTSDDFRRRLDDFCCLLQSTCNQEIFNKYLFSREMFTTRPIIPFFPSVRLKTFSQNYHSHRERLIELLSSPSYNLEQFPNKVRSYLRNRFLSNPGEGERYILERISASVTHDIGAISDEKEELPTSAHP